MNSKQTIFCICIVFLVSAVAKQPDFGRRDKRNFDVREYLDEVVTGVNEFEQQLVEQQNALQLLAERYAELVVKNQELLEQNGKLARQDADLAIQTANQNAALQRRNAELTNQITELTNQTQDLFRLNSQLVAKVAHVEKLGEAVTKREEALVKQNAELTKQLTQVGVALNQSKEISNLQSTVHGRRLDQMSVESQQKLLRTEETLSKKLNLTESLMKEYTTNQVIQLTNRISTSADVAKRELTAHIHDINARLSTSVSFLQTQATTAANTHTTALKNLQDTVMQRLTQLEKKHANETQVLAATFALHHSSNKQAGSSKHWFTPPIMG